MVDGESPRRNVMEIGDVEKESFLDTTRRITVAPVSIVRLLAEPAVS